MIQYQTIIPDRQLAEQGRLIYKYSYPKNIIGVYKSTKA